MLTKHELRQQLRKIIAEIPPDEIQKRSLWACQLLTEQPEYAKADVVMTYLSLPNEVDTTPLVMQAWRDHKRVLAPKVNWGHRRMVPVEIQSLTNDVGVSAMGLREPITDAPFPISAIDLVIVPGLGFDPAGNRLGRGKGFYDGFLSDPELKGLACAMAFEEQVVPSIPVDSRDHPMNLLITDAKIHRFS